MSLALTVMHVGYNAARRVQTCTECTDRRCNNPWWDLWREV